MISLDTQVVIHCMKPLEDEIGERAKALLARCEQENLPIMLSPIVVAELLAGVPEAKEIEYLQTLKRRFVSPPFDDICALRFARIWRANQLRVKQLQSEDITRNRIRMDWLVVASSLAHQATCIYSEDAHVHKCAEGLIEVRYLRYEPIPAKQDQLL